jgi:hypothetical protein
VVNFRSLESSDNQEPRRVESSTEFYAGIVVMSTAAGAVPGLSFSPVDRIFSFIRRIKHTTK